MKCDSKFRFGNSKIETKIKNQINQMKHNKSIEADKFVSNVPYSAITEKNSTEE